MPTANKTFVHRLKNSTDPHSKFKNRYRFSGEVLGSGCYAEVRTVINRATGVEYACKVCPLTDESDEGNSSKEGCSLLKQVEHELDMMMALRHDGLVQLQEAFIEEPTVVYVVMEKLGGGTLKQHVGDAAGASHGFPEARAQEVFKQIMQALAFMHARNIVHGDIKLENVLFSSTDDDATVKIIDLGLAKSVASGSLHQTCGTPMFAAPELMDVSGTAEYGTAIDCWAAGVLLHILLIGSPPFQHTDPQVLLDGILHSEVKLEGDLWESVSLDAKHLLAGLLVKDKSTRATSADALQHPWLVYGPGDRTRGWPALVAKIRPRKDGGGHAPRVAKKSSATEDQKKIGHHRRSTFASTARKEAISSDHNKPSGSTTEATFTRAKTMTPRRIVEHHSKKSTQVDDKPRSSKKDAT